MVLFIISLVLLIIAAVNLCICLVSVLQAIIKRWKKASLDKAAARIKKSAVLLTVSAVLIAGLVTVSQLIAKTPQIADQNGKITNDSIAKLEKVELNGRQEWISIRGKNRSNPVLLFLAGGPGGTQMAATRYELSELEDRFVVVNWDQPGSGKSYGAISKDKITVDTYIKDGLALTDLLRKRFNTEKIYLIGESWGSALGIFLVNAAPEKYQAFIGTGQMVDFKQTEITDYKKAMELATEFGDKNTVQKLVANGMPPYYGADVTWKSVAYLDYLSMYMQKNPEITNSGYHTPRDVFSSEYGIVDSVNYFRGVVETFNQVYPQLYKIDMRKDFTKLKVPVYFFLGRHDINAPLPLAQEYFNLLDAPKKEIVWFEHSGHDPWLNESKLFVTQTLRVFLGG